MSGWKKGDDVPEPKNVEEAAPEPTKRKKKEEPSEESSSPVRARTRARTNGQNSEMVPKSKVSEILGLLDSVRAHHGHPQLERASTSQRWPVWVIETIATKSQVEKRPAADIIAETFKRGLANDPWAEHHYAEACERTNARENDWGVNEEDID